MKLEELRVYNFAMEMGEQVWGIVGKWGYFEKDTIGKQWVRAMDSVAANLSEGFGRYHYKENRNYGYYSRGSLFESRTWLVKAHNRGLVQDDAFNSMSKDLETIGIKLNNYIKSIGCQTTDGSVKEEQLDYGTPWDNNDAPQGAND